MFVASKPAGPPQHAVQNRAAEAAAHLKSGSDSVAARSDENSSCVLVWSPTSTNCPPFAPNSVRTSDSGTGKSVAIGGAFSMTDKIESNESLDCDGIPTIISSSTLPSLLPLSPSIFPRMSHSGAALARGVPPKSPRLQTQQYLIVRLNARAARLTCHTASTCCDTFSHPFSVRAFQPSCSVSDRLHA